MDLTSEKIGEYIYAIVNGSEHFIYAPLAGVFVQCEAQDVQTVREALRGGAVNEDMMAVVRQLTEKDFSKTTLTSDPRCYTKMSVLANYKCNLQCSYCYSALGRSATEITAVQLTAALDFFLNQAKAGERRSLFFSGGGEPLLSWRIIRSALERALEQANKNNILLEVHFMTNGTIYRNDISNFLKQHGCTLCFSYEILEPLQNEIRGHYSLVSENLRKYLQDGNEIYISSTITPKSVGLLKEMVVDLVRRFPGIRTVTMEPVTGSEIYGSPAAMKEFYDRFDQNFKEAYETANKFGISLHTSSQGITDNYVSRYCPGKFCLTPLGTYTICHCASSPQEERFEKCMYGYIDDTGTPKFDEKKFRSLLDVNSSSYHECQDCFADIHCGGECMTRRDTYAPEYMVEVCRHTRKNALNELLNALSEDD